MMVILKKNIYNTCVLLFYQANHTVHPTFSWPHSPNQSMLQGFYMATPAVDVSFFMNFSKANQATAYLEGLRSTLEKFEK